MCNVEVKEKRVGKVEARVNDVDKLPGEIPRGTPVPLETEEAIPLWNRWELLTLVTSLLTAEWLLRKRWKLV